MADFTSRINELLANTTEHESAIADALGVSKQTISAWKKGIRFPKKPVIRSVAEFFGVSVPWLEGITDDPTIGIDVTTADPQEVELLSIYRGLNATGRNVLLGTARGLAANPDMKKDLKSNTETA